MKFEPGKTYYDTSAFDHYCVFEISVMSRSKKMLTIIDHDGHKRRCKIHMDAEGEFILPDRYSMAPVFRASRGY